MTDYNLSGKHILVTGASSGMGRRFAQMAASCGANVSLLARNEVRLQETMSTLTGEGHDYYVCDLIDEEQVKTVVSTMQPVDGVVYFAGVNEFVPIKFVNQEKIDKIFETNYFSSLILTRHLLKKKLINKGASLVFISSLSAVMGVPGTLLYASSKAAINSAVKVLASELAPQRIRVNSICPGIVKTEMLENTNIDASQFDEQEKDYPLGLGAPDDVGNAVLFHLSDDSRWLTGNIMILDGGNSLQ